jgi:hypothetical protein
MVHSPYLLVQFRLSLVVRNSLVVVVAVVVDYHLVVDENSQVF